MPTIQYEGQTHVFPDDFTEKDIADALSSLPAPPSMAADIGKGLVSGAGKAVTGTLGLPGDVASLLNRAIDYGAAKLGLPVAPANYDLGTSAQVQRGVEKVTGKFPEPQTLPGKAIEKGLEFLPAVFGGPEALGTKLATRVAVPAAAMTAAEQATDNPFAQVAAAVGASALAHRAVTPKAAAGLAAEDLAAAAKQNYQDVHALGLELKAQPVANLAHQIENSLTADGLTARNAAPVYDAINTLKNPPAGAVVTSQNFDNLRKEMVQATRSTDGAVRTAAGRTIGMLDDYLASIPASHVLKGNAAQAASLFADARANYAASKRAEMVGGKLDLAELNAATAHSGANIDNATRQAIKQLIRPDKYGKLPAEKAGFNAAEIAQMKAIARGSTIGNLTRTAGNLLGGGGGIGALGAAYAGHELGGTEGIALPLLGRGLRGLGNRMTTAAGQRLATQVVARSPEGRAFAAMLARNPMPAGLSAAQTGLLSGLFAQRALIDQTSRR